MNDTIIDGIITRNQRGPWWDSTLRRSHVKPYDEDETRQRLRDLHFNDPLHHRPLWGNGFARFRLHYREDFGDDGRPQAPHRVTHEHIHTLIRADTTTADPVTEERTEYSTEYTLLTDDAMLTARTCDGVTVHTVEDVDVNPTGPDDRIPAGDDPYAEQVAYALLRGVDPESFRRKGEDRDACSTEDIPIPDTAEPAHADFVRHYRSTASPLALHLAIADHEATTAGELAAALFGDTAAGRKDLVRAIGTARLDDVFFISDLYDTDKPVDWAVNALNELRHGRDPLNYRTGFRRLFGGLDARSRARLLKRRRSLRDDTALGFIANTVDVIEQLLEVTGEAGKARYTEAAPTQARTWAEVAHGAAIVLGRLTALATDIGAEAERRREKDAAQWFAGEEGRNWLRRIDEDRAERARLRAEAEAERNRKAEEAKRLRWTIWREFGELIADADPIPVAIGGASARATIVMAEKKEQLDAWGKQLRNCIGGYSPEPDQGTALLAVYADNRLWAAVEVVLDASDDDTPIRQFNGEANATPEARPRVLVSQEITRMLRLAQAEARIDLELCAL